jgi:pyruvate dehydrogenase E2 component (dihydrolipoamide acetyltransferase)
MAFEIVLPRLGWQMEAGSLVEWYKNEGELVQQGEILFSVEGDKAIQEVEALESGILRIPPDAPQPGEQVPVGTVLGYLVQEGEPVPFEAEPAHAEVQAAAVTSAQPAAPGAAPITQEATLKTKGRTGSKPAISPRARRIARELGIDWTLLRGSGRTGRIVERDVRQAAQEREREIRVKVSPVAQRLAEASGVDVTELAAQKPGHKITREDVETAIAARERVAAPPVPAPTVGVAVPVTPIRRVIARRMVESAHTTAPLTLTTDVDASELVAVRERLKATLGPRGKVVPTYNDLMIKLTGFALQEHPMLNAYWQDDEIVTLEDVNIGTAVDTEAGLLVPVIRNVPAKSVQQIAEEARELIEKARARQLASEDMQGGTFTITNMGKYNIDAFTPIINLPECAILGVGRIVDRPAVWQGQVVPRKMVALSLTFDHRVVDGGPAARFLNTIREFVRDPYLWLVA